MRIALFLVLAGCIGNDIPATSFASVQGTPAIQFAHSTTGLTNYNNTAFYQFNVTLGAIESCTAEARATFEIDTFVLGGTNTFPLGAIPIRADAAASMTNTAYATLDGATSTTGTLTINSADDKRVSGSFDITLTTGQMTGSFIAFTCP